MDMEGALRARIVALATAAAARVYWVDRPQGTALPSITLQIISGDHPYTYSGSSRPATHEFNSTSGARTTAKRNPSWMR
jgi:hypothetical protein